MSDNGNLFVGGRSHCLQLLLGVLLIIVSPALRSEVVTYVVNGRSSVRVSGVEPEGAQAKYMETATTGRVGQMTIGNCVTFTICELPNILVSGISLKMHSNSSAGAGELHVYQNTEEVAHIADEPFSSKSWNGRYTSSFVNVSVDVGNRLVVNAGDSITVTVCASENSLYVSELSIEWAEANKKTYAVSFSLGTGKTLPLIYEESPNSGIILPDIEDINGWQLVGWTTQRVQISDSVPAYMPPNTVFYPQHHTMLFALYSNESSKERLWQQALSYEDGYYLIGDTYKHCLAMGGLNGDGKIDVYRMPEWVVDEDSLYSMLGFDYPEETVYEIQFFSDSTASIRNVATDEHIGYSTSSALRLTRNDVTWQYTILGDNQIRFYHQYSPTSVRYFWATEGETLKTAEILTFAAQSYCYTGYALVLFNIEEQPDRPQYTFSPLTTDVEAFTAYSACQIVNGKIINPQKEKIEVYTVAGMLVYTANTDVNLMQLPKGMLILVTEGGESKLFVN